MKPKQQTSYWLHSRAREAYINAKRGGEFDRLVFSDWDDTDTDRGYLDLSVNVPVHIRGNWEGLGA